MEYYYYIFLRIVKPEVARDEDIFFATIGLLYSCILMVHGWRLDPILLFSQVLIIASLISCWMGKYSITRITSKYGKTKEKGKSDINIFLVLVSIL